jgi:hypothetical protein
MAKYNIFPSNFFNNLTTVRIRIRRVYGSRSRMLINYRSTTKKGVTPLIYDRGFGFKKVPTYSIILIHTRIQVIWLIVRMSQVGTTITQYRTRKNNKTRDSDCSRRLKSPLFKYPYRHWPCCFPCRLVMSLASWSLCCWRDSTCSSSSSIRASFSSFWLHASSSIACDSAS